MLEKSGVRNRCRCRLAQFLLLLILMMVKDEHGPWTWMFEDLIVAVPARRNPNSLFLVS